MMDSTNGGAPASGRPAPSVFALAMKHIFTLVLLASTAMAQTQTPSATVSPSATATATASQTVKPDNTRKNAKEDLTAEQQGGSAADREMTKNIRRGLMKNDSLSSMAKNIKIITIEGKVTLRGPVHSEQEKAMAGSIAEKAAGKGKVMNQLEVKK